MSFSSVAALPAPLPEGVTAEAIPDGVRVTFSSRRPSFSDRRLWVAGVLAFVSVVIPVYLFFSLVGQARVWLPILVEIGAVSGIFSAVYTRKNLARRGSAPGKVELTRNQLTIDEPGLSYSQRRPQVGSSHMSYALADLCGFTVAHATDDPGFEQALAVHMTNRLQNYHLKGRRAEQLRWACEWLSEALRTAELHGGALRPAQKPRGKESFVYDENGPRT